MPAPADTRTLAEFVQQTSFDDISPTVADRALVSVIDTVAAMLAGLTSEVGRCLFDYVGASNHDDPYRLVEGPAAGGEAAALAMGTLAHALDYDDVLSLIPAHPSGVILPAILAVDPGHPISGRQLLLAYVVGVEVAGRVGECVGQGHYARGWHSTGTICAFGAAAAACKVLGLSAESTAMAMGIAASGASGIQCNFGTMGKPLHSGLAARTGVLAARLASLGFVASEDALGAPRGFVAVYGDGDSSLMPLSRLGRPYVLADPGIAIKRYPCCYATHRAVDGIRTLRNENGLNLDAITEIKCEVPPGGLRPLAYQHPRTGLEGKFSMHYCLASALVDGDLRFDAFRDDAVKRSRVQALMKLIDVRESPECCPEDPTGRYHSAGTSGFVRITVRSGSTADQSIVVRHPTGAPASPLSWEDLKGKFTDCVREGGKPVEAAARWFGDLRSMESIVNVRPIILKYVFGEASEAVGI